MSQLSANSTQFTIIAMSFQAPITIAEALNHIDSGYYLLPAIQREFEWSPEKIEWLFDSLMREYPISSFLFWSVEGASRTGYRFYDFLKHYRQRFKTHNDEASTAREGGFIAVLDGQQRLTSLYIGLRGSYAWKEYNLSWENDERRIPTRHLYLNISHELSDQEDDRVYQFSFLKKSETLEQDIYARQENGTETLWFRVGKINDLREFSTFLDFATEAKLSKFGSTTLSRLHSVVFTKQIINYFLEKEQDLHKALNIFIRINSGGIPLDFSDLIMSIAVANWRKKDARQEIHNLVDSVQKLGFSIQKDFIFKTYLYLYSTDIKFKVTNFSAENAHNFEADWEKIRDAIYEAFLLVGSFGYDDYTLASKNAVIPIIYYIYHRAIYHEFNVRLMYRGDREDIQKWLHVMLLKRVFGAGGADGTLSQIRKAFTEDVTLDPKLKPEIDAFPVTEISQQIKRDLSVGPEFIEDLLKTQKDNRYAFSILALLSPHLDYRSRDFHKDHLHPISAFSAKEIARLEMPEEAKERFRSLEWSNSIINLQMLDGAENQSKQNKDLATWVAAEAERLNSEEGRILDRCIIPQKVSLAFSDFADFAEKRKALLAEKLTQILK